METKDNMKACSEIGHAFIELHISSNTLVKNSAQL